MRCIAGKEIKDCCNQESCCYDCGYEDCHEGCKTFEEKYNGCDYCEYVVKTVFDGIKKYDIDKLAIYLHSFQCENYTVQEIKELLNMELSNFECN